MSESVFIQILRAYEEKFGTDHLEELLGPAYRRPEFFLALAEYVTAGRRLELDEAYRRFGDSGKEWDPNEEIPITGLGAPVGHEFYGNQYVDGTSTHQTLANHGDHSTPEELATALNHNAKLSEGEISADMMTVSRASRGELSGLKNAVKGVGSTARKIRDDAAEEGISHKQAALKINDTVRHTMVFNDKTIHSDAQASLDHLRSKGYEVVKVKSFVTNPIYKGVNVKLKAPNGLTTELQFHTAHSLKVKEEQSHPIYEELRVTKDRDTISRLESQLKTVWAPVVLPLALASIY